MEIDRPDLPSRCTWQPNAKNSPHTKRTPVPQSGILPHILNYIGQTPIVRLNNITKSLDIKCEIVAKCEFFNPGGSTKDRIAYRMILDAEEKGILKPGYTIIEPTSGNTGIGLAMAAVVKGYRCIIVMPDKMSNEKFDTIHALGAEVVKVRSEAAWDSPESYLGVSQKLQKEIPNSVILNQYTNPSNPLAHYDETAQEIWEQCNGKVDYLVAGAGTCGTVTGLARRFKELSPKTKIVGIDPEGSRLAEPLPPGVSDESECFYEVEGIGYIFSPTVMDRKPIDLWMRSNDKESFNTSRLLISKEGLLCGGSSGAAMSAALKLAKDLPADKRIVVILPDGIRNYMTKFLSDQWMEARGFLEPPPPTEANKWWWNSPISNLHLNPPATLPVEATCQEAIAILKKKGLDQIPVVEENGNVQGFVTTTALISNIISGVSKPTDTLDRLLFKKFRKLTLSDTLGRLSRVLEKESYVAIISTEKETEKLLGVVTRMDILDYVNKSYSNGDACAL